MFATGTSDGPVGAIAFKTVPGTGNGVRLVSARDGPGAFTGRLHVEVDRTPEPVRVEAARLQLALRWRLSVGPASMISSCSLNHSRTSPTTNTSSPSSFRWGIRFSAFDPVWR